jgi:hypothetical protein
VCEGGSYDSVGKEHKLRVVRRIFGYEREELKGKGKGKGHLCTGTDALYRPYIGEVEV